METYCCTNHWRNTSVDKFFGLLTLKVPVKWNQHRRNRAVDLKGGHSQINGTTLMELCRRCREFRYSQANGMRSMESLCQDRFWRINIPQKIVSKLIRLHTNGITSVDIVFNPSASYLTTYLYLYRSSVHPGNLCASYLTQTRYI